MDIPILDRCSYFIENKALFGGFPSQTDIHTLESLGVRVFVNLTIPSELKTVSYKSNYIDIGYPIQDKKIPTNIDDFYAFIATLSSILFSLKPDEKMYIHCKGGHGRSGVVVACLLCMYYGISAEDALCITKKCHQSRKTMRDIWRRIGSPQTKDQKDFVRGFAQLMPTVKNDFDQHESR
jgi:hypothetical protein